MLEQKNITVKAGSSFQTICPFPVGYIYQSYNSTSPANIYGGSWIAIAGRFLYCNNGTSVGGSNTHTLSVNEMPSHSHGFAGRSARVAQAGSTVYVVEYKADEAHPSFIRYAGSSAPHNNMPAYQTCYAWRRTA